MRSAHRAVRWRAPVGWGLLGLVIIALGDAAIRLAPAGTDVAAWWPAAGLAIAVGLRVGRSGVRWASLTTFLASVVANVTTGRDPDVALLFAATNAAEVLLTCLLILRWNPERSLSSLARLAQMGTAAVIGSLVAGVAAGAVVTGLLGGDFWVIVRAVWASHLAAALIFLPFAGPRRHERQSSRTERITTAVVLLGVTLALFAPDQDLPIVFVLFPMFVLMAFRQSLQACAVQLILVNVAVTAASAAGWGPLVLAVQREGLPPETTGTLIELLILSTTVMVYALRITVESRIDAHSSALRARRDLQAVLQAASATAIIETDPEGTIRVFNQGAVNMLGYTAEEMVGHQTPALFHDPDEVAARAVELGISPGFEVFVHEIRGPERNAERRDWTYITSRGRRRVVSLVVTRVEDDDGNTIGYLGIAEDVDVQRKVEALLVQSLEDERSLAERLRDADALKAEFVSSVSHELRTPMTSVLGYAEILSDLYGEALGPQGSAIVGRIQSSGHRLLSLIDSLLTLARTDSGGDRLEREEVDVRVAAYHAVSVLTPLALTDDISVHLVEPLEQQLVVGDGVAIERVIINLISNAIKFSRAGDRITVAFAETDPDTTILTVTDTGVGIPTEDLDQIFDRFHRAANATASATPGTGLGLAIVKSIVEQHGGAVAVTSQLGRGTTFTVRLPRQPADRLVATTT